VEDWSAGRPQKFVVKLLSNQKVKQKPSEVQDKRIKMQQKARGEYTIWLLPNF
jgi:hypothetical protein